jgi:predicted Zn-dependent protease
MLVHLPNVRSVNEKATQDPNLKMLLARLEKNAPTQGYAFDLLVLDADFVNAFALPGGYMLVSTGLIKACRTPDELAGVLAHEMAHVTQQHGTRRLLREHVWTLFLRLASGSDGLAAQLAGSVITSSFNRNDEREADAKGVERLVSAGINPMGLADFFARLEKEDGEEKKISGLDLMSYVASHPELAERRENIRRLMQTAARENAPAFSPAMSPKQWLEFRAACGIAAATHALREPFGPIHVRPAA